MAPHSASRSLPAASTPTRVNQVHKSRWDKIYGLDFFHCLPFFVFSLLFFLNTLPFINKPIARRPGHTHSAMFLSPSYRSAAGCHRNGLIVAKWGMLMQSSILPSAVGFLCPSHSAVCTVVHLCLHVHVFHSVAFTATSLDYHCLF